MTTKKTPKADPHLTEEEEIPTPKWSETPEGVRGLDVPFEEPEETPDWDAAAAQTPDSDGDHIIRRRIEVQRDIAEAQAKRIPRRRKAATAAIVAEALRPDTDPSIASAIVTLKRELELAKREIAKLTKRAENEDQGEGGYPFMYYKRPKDGGAMSGWIVVASGGIGPQTGGRDVGVYATLLGKGFKPLPRYGIVGSPATYPKPGAQFVTFLQNGGAKDVPASQVLQLRWHIEPPLAGTVFPQYEKALAEDRVRHFMCDEGGCDRGFWFLDDDSETAGACLDHLRRTHEYKFTEARALLKEQGINLSASQRARAAALARDARAARGEEDDEDEEDDD